MSSQDLITLVVAVAGIAIALVAVATRRERTHLGLGPRGRTGSDLASGAAIGLSALALLWAVLVATGLGDPGPGGGPRGLGTAAGIVVAFAILFLVEEVAFRGVGTGGLAAYVGIWPATVVVNVLVALAYVFADHTSVHAVVLQVLSNLVLGTARVRTGRIWAGYALKIGWNAGMVVLGMPDAGYAIEHPLLGMRFEGPTWLTGGAFGAEAGLVGALVLVLMLLATLRLRRPSPADQG